MRKVKIGTQELELRASPLAPLLYRQTFGAELLADLGGLATLGEDLGKGDLSNFDPLLVLQFAYAMNKTANRKMAMSFEDWLDHLDYVDYGEPEWIMEVVNLAVDGFFRTRGTVEKPAGKSKPDAKKDGFADTGERQEDGA